MNCLDLHTSLEDTAARMIHLMDSIPVESNAVIVYDIDNTLMYESGKPIVPMLRTYWYALQKGFKTVLISSRVGLPEVVAHTLNQLAEVGIGGYQYLYLRKLNQDVYQFKFLSRRDLHDKGLHVVMSVGDQKWDMGPYGGYGIHVPTCNHTYNFVEVNVASLNFVNCSVV